MDKVAIIALIDSLIEESIEDKIHLFKGSTGRRGPRGQNGKDFDFEEHKESIKNLISNRIDAIKEELKLSFSDLSNNEKEQLKLKFSDLTEEELSKLRGQKGPRGQRGKQGPKGEDFNFEKHKDEVFSIIEKIYSKGKAELKLKFSDLTEEEKEQLKLKFSDLTEEELSKLRGQKGPRGQRGKQGPKGEDGKDGIDGKDGKEGPIGPMGMPGIPGLNGRNGKDGIDGKDAPEIIDVEVEVEGSELRFVFYFSDNTLLRSNFVELPMVTKYISSCISSISDGGGLSALKILQDGNLVGESEELDFSTENFEVTFDAVNKRSIVKSKRDCISISDEGDQIVSCVKDINFVGENVEVVSGTKMSDWPTLDVVDPIGSWESPNSGNVTVKVLTTEVAKRLEVTRICDEAIQKNKAVTATSGTNVSLGQCDNETKARILGIALEDGAAGDTIRILLFGQIEDSFFNFGLNKELYLGFNGDISDAIPSGANYMTTIGSSNGSGSIFVNIDNPIEM